MLTSSGGFAGGRLEGRWAGSNAAGQQGLRPLQAAHTASRHTCERRAGEGASDTRAGRGQLTGGRHRRAAAQAALPLSRCCCGGSGVRHCHTPLNQHYYARTQSKRKRTRRHSSHTTCNKRLHVSTPRQSHRHSTLRCWLAEKVQNKKRRQMADCSNAHHAPLDRLTRFATLLLKQFRYVSSK